MALNTAPIEPLGPDWASAGEILIAIAIGAIIGITIARRIAMTAMPELVAAFHSLVYYWRNNFV